MNANYPTSNSLKERKNILEETLIKLEPLDFESKVNELALMLDEGELDIESILERVKQLGYRLETPDCFRYKLYVDDIVREIIPAYELVKDVPSRHEEVCELVSAILIEKGKDLNKHRVEIELSTGETTYSYFVGPDISIPIYFGFNIKARKKLIEKWLDLEEVNKSKRDETKEIAHAVESAYLPEENFITVEAAGTILDLPPEVMDKKIISIANNLVEKTGNPLGKYISEISREFDVTTVISLDLVVAIVKDISKRCDELLDAVTLKKEVHENETK